MKISFRIVAALTFFMIAVRVGGQSTQPELPERVVLDETGIGNWQFVNPIQPFVIGNRPLEFFNSTGDRTFVVTIPFVYPASELATAFALADEDRAGRVVSEIVLRALEHNGETLLPQELNELDTREGLRVLSESVSGAKPTSLAKACDGHLKGADCIVETLFWTATCQPYLEHQRLLELARQPELAVLPEDLKKNPPVDSLEGALKREALELLKNLLGEPSAWPTCSFEVAKDRQERMDEELTVGADPTPAIDPVAAEAKSSGLKARFAADRVRLAKEALQNAIRDRLTDLERLCVKGVLDRLQAQRDRLQEQEKKAPRQEREVLQCHLREVEAAAKLLTSYGLDSQVPYRGVPRTLLTDRKCEDWTPEDDSEIMQRIGGYVAARASDVGTEVSDCQSSSSGTTCVATATIPPYGSATFSSAVLAHHPTPRIRFNVAFFGETEVPGNANGYVTRAKSDVKPKSEFSLVFGGGASTSLDPDKAVRGQLRHSGGTGSLSFQYTGIVEASATLQFKGGDFGGSDDTNKISASQYQGKVFGHNITRFNYGLVFQYGRLQFAKPSSGIAVNVNGEGMQVALGPASLGYIVLRESDNPGQIADTQNDDSDLWILQVKNISFDIPFLRTLDLVALRGKDRKDDSDKPADTVTDSETPVKVPRPFTYYSVGGEARWGWRKFPTLGGSFAYYYSHRDVETLPNQRAELSDGRGGVWLVRASWSHIAFPKFSEPQKKIRPEFGLTALLGRGTGDKKRTENVDEGYLGQNATFSNDVLFLSKVSQAFKDDIGRGLANKWYGGLQYTDQRWSPLATIARSIINVPESDIESTSTILTLHGYRFVRDVHGRHWGGSEVNLDFNLEAPKKIRWTLGGAYYRGSTAVELVGLKHDLWSASAGVTISLSNP